MELQPVKFGSLNMAAYALKTGLFGITLQNAGAATSAGFHLEANGGRVVHHTPGSFGLPEGLRLDLDRYHQNTDRAHTGRWTKGRTPEAVIGKVKMWSR